MVIGNMLEVLEGLHHRVERRTKVVTAQRKTSGEWEWPPVAEALETSGIWLIK